MTVRKGLFLLFAGLLFIPHLMGCQMLHELTPVRLKRLNHGVDGMPASDYQTSHPSSRLRDTGAFASVADPVGQEGG